jgi:hypothetical protein
MSTDIEEILSLLTLEEKVSLLAGADEWQTQGIERLGVGVVKVRTTNSGAHKYHHTHLQCHIHYSTLWLEC